MISINEKDKEDKKFKEVPKITIETTSKKEPKITKRVSQQYINTNHHQQS